MRAVVQRASSASVEVEGKTTGEIRRGLVVFLAIAAGDTPREAEYMADKIAGLRIFADEQGKMNLDVRQASGSLLVVSQFTLYGDVTRGRRPAFDRAAPPDQALSLYECFVGILRARRLSVETGVFKAAMTVRVVNDGPVTIIIDTDKIT
jgi:D-tyrosyl-tRNA(Tyr) deacylase